MSETEIKKVYIDGVEMCPQCGINPAQAPHTCPFLVEIDDNYDDLCTCCKDCESDCGDDI